MKKFISYLFRRDHLVAAIWSVATGILVGVYFTCSTGPTKVEVVNTENGPDTIFVRFDQAPTMSSDQLEKTISQLAQDVRALRSSSRPSTDRTLADRLNKLPGSSASDVAKPRGREAIVIPLVTVPPTVHIAEIQIPRFSLPSTTKGYVQSSLSTLASVELRAMTVKRDSVLDLPFQFLNPSILGKTSPVIVDIVRRNGPNSVTLVSNQQYSITEGPNIIRLVADLAPGVYELEVATYLLGELGGEYPPRYGNRVALTVLE